MYWALCKYNMLTLVHPLTVEYRTSGDYFIIFDAVQNHLTTYFVRQ